MSPAFSGYSTLANQTSVAFTLLFRLSISSTCTQLLDVHMQSVSWSLCEAFKKRLIECLVFGEKDHLLSKLGYHS